MEKREDRRRQIGQLTPLSEPHFRRGDDQRDRVCGVRCMRARTVRLEHLFAVAVVGCDE
jgi:hypothetical protein